MKKEKNQIQQVYAIPVSAQSKYLILSFIFPAAILGTVFAILRIYPFGDGQILIEDFWHQYYPFLSSFWHKLREGTVSSWSWTAGAGHDYVTLIAYYMASPLNILAFLAPHTWLRETLTLILLIKIACSGLFMTIFLRYTFKQSSFALPIFSSLYALCAWTLGYFWNIMWLDSFAILPLVMQGLLVLVNEGKYRLYIVSLALAVWMNFYIGFFICIFIAIAFFSLFVIKKLIARDFIYKLGLTVVYSTLALGICAVFLLPSLSVLQNTFSAESAFPDKMILYRSFLDILGNFLAFTPPTFVDGLPNLYCGLISVILTGVYIISPKVSIREKIILIGIVIFLLLICNLNVLDFIIHGFRNTNLMPSRFSFLIPFMFVIMAYRAYLLIESISRRDLFILYLSATMLLSASFFGSHNKASIIGNIVICTVYCVVLYFTVRNTGKTQKFFKSVFILVIAVELVLNSFISIKAAPLTSRSKYPDRYKQIQALLLKCSNDNSDFFRVEIDQFFTFNDPSLYNYNGISFFSSTINDNVTGFMRGIGLTGGGKGNNAFIYNETTPLINAFLGMRYLITCGTYPADNFIFWNVTGASGDSLLFENVNNLPLGFMVNENIETYAHYTDNPFLSQNDLFSMATGLDSNLFTITELTNSAQISGNYWNYEMSTDSMIYVFCENDGANKVAVFVNGSFFHEIYLPQDVPYISAIGSFIQGDIISFTKGARIFMGCLNLELFEQGYALLADEPLNLTHFSETKVRGSVTALQDGILYTSIPGRNWNVYVDGVKSELLLIDNAMAAVRLSKGMHEVEFRYLNKSFVAGVIISIVSLAVFAMMIIFDIRKRRKENVK